MKIMKEGNGVGAWVEAGVSFIYPPVCQICETRRAGPDEGFVCEQCQQRVQTVQAPYCERCGLPYEGSISADFECANCREMKLRFTYARAAAVANDFLLDIIHRYKYQRSRWFETFLGDLLIRQAGPVIREQRWEVIVPVPLHPFKEREREFNQAVKLARLLGEALQLPVEERSVRRAEDTRTQTRLTRAERAANVAGAFEIADGRKIAGRRVVLVDDVLTTGATTSSCAGTLLKGGAAEVCVWTVARGV
jgi:ComF family protein